MTKYGIAKHLMRFFMIACWFGFLSIFLFGPKILDSFIHQEEKSINVYCWADVLDPVYIKEFEQETGIKVNMGYYEQNYELFSKMSLTKGAGYDLVMVTDFALPFLREHHLLKEIDTRNVASWSVLEPSILNKPFDPGNHYSIPYFWDLYALGYSKKCVNHIPVPTTLGALFDPLYLKNRIAMVDEANEAVTIAKTYMFGDKEMQEADWQEVKKVLTRQKEYVEAYTDLRTADLISSRAVCLGITQAAFLRKMIAVDSSVGLSVPEPKTFMVVDSFVIPHSTAKDEYVYAFINFMLKKEVLSDVTKKFFYLPARRDVLIEEDLSIFGGIDALERYANKAMFFQAGKQEALMSRLWLEVKAY